MCYAYDLGELLIAQGICNIPHQLGVKQEINYSVSDLVLPNIGHRGIKPFPLYVLIATTSFVVGCRAAGS